MKYPEWLPNLILIIGIIIFTSYFWNHLIISKKKEGFVDLTDSHITAVGDMTQTMLKNNKTAENEEMPTDSEIVLLYIK